MPHERMNNDNEISVDNFKSLKLNLSYGVFFVVKMNTYNVDFNYIKSSFLREKSSN